MVVVLYSITLNINTYITNKINKVENGGAQ